MATLLIRGGRILDPVAQTDQVGDLAVQDGLIVAPGPELCYDQIIDAAGCIVTPGLIDYHAHLAATATGLGISPAASYHPMGVTTAVDAGSTGVDNYLAFRAQSLTEPMRIRAFLNVCPGGLVSGAYHENIDPRVFQPARMLALLSRFGDQLIGLKVRQSADIAGPHGLAPLRAMLEIARQAECPVAVHTTDPAGAPSEIMRLLRPGDVYAHVFQGKGRTILEAGRLLPLLYETQKRGVIFDAANGSNHFSFRVARAALAEGFLPDIISTDLTVKTLYQGRRVFSLPFVMSKYLALGLTLPQIVQRTTQIPARLLGQERELGSLAVGTPADIAILRCVEKPTVFEDHAGERLTGSCLLRTELTLQQGVCVFRQIDF